jgi:prepilin-type processing-associated H-X9-DG protein
VQRKRQEMYDLQDNVSLNQTANPPTFGDSPGTGQFVGRHFSGADFVFLDGHVKWLRLDTIARKNTDGRYPFFTKTMD